MYIHKYTCICALVYTRHICKYTHIHVYVRMYIRNVHVKSMTYMYIFTRTNICAYAHTQRCGVNNIDVHNAYL